MSKSLSFIDKARTMHGDKYDYSLVDYKTVDDKVDIICPTHGLFHQTPYKHINSKYGCALCAKSSSAVARKSNTEEFIKKAKAVHGDKYSYSKTLYSSAKDKLTIICPVHGEFEQLASGHLSGYGCKECTSYGKGRVPTDKPCSLYYLHLPDLGYYKIGITSLDIRHRYRTKFDTEQFEIVFVKTYSSGKDAFDEEQRLLKQYDSLKYKGSTKILKSGNTEIFTEDIFKGNYNEIFL